MRTHMEGYRSGHNEAVLKTVWAKAHVGSNPTPSANLRLKTALAARDNLAAFEYTNKGDRQ